MKHKIYVYAICKNEEKFARRWMESVSEADAVYVLDTGSTDGSVKLLASLGAKVLCEKIEPWRFDTARNRSLRMVPKDADLCVCVDLDEVFEKGWREKMEAAVSGGAQLLRYRYTWSFYPNGREGHVFMTEKAHSRQGFCWANPVHEVLSYSGGEPLQITEAVGVRLFHFPDPEKSRRQYLPLLELSVREDPENDRNSHYLGREYMFYGMWEKCRAELLRHLSLKSAVWKDERSASMRFLARAYAALGDETEAECWLLRACAEAPHLREPWLDTAKAFLKKKNWAGALFFASRALDIPEESTSYINEPESRGAAPYDIAAVAAYYSGEYEKALLFGRKACELSPKDERLMKNLTFYESKRSLH